MKNRLLDEALNLPIQERLELVDALWGSIVVEPDALPLSDELRSELDPRLKDLEDRPGDEYRWEDVKVGITRRK